jgi:putative ATPase
MDLFDRVAEQDAQAAAPLADRMRPRTLGEFVAQEHLTGEGRFLRRVLGTTPLPSLILWGPPGTGKTTLARIIASAGGAHFIQLSAVLAGVKDIREAVSQAEERWKLNRQRTVLFLDEIHRFNKAQQDALLPHVERGTLSLIGATTENPSFEVNAALLSRARVVTLRALEEDELRELLFRALNDARGLNGSRTAEEEAIRTIARASGGDARRALTTLEVAAQQSDGRIDLKAVEEALQQKTLLYDRAGDEHYNVVSAFIKSLRGSDPDAALYWMARMLEAGEDPKFVLRRMVIFASEDVGNAEPSALSMALNAFRAYELVGMPEAVLTMSQAVIFLACAPKSNAALTAYAAAREAVTDKGALPVPAHLRNAPTQLMKSLGFGAGYQYPHDFEGSYVPAEYLPDALVGSRFYQPAGNGRERSLKELLQTLRAKKGQSETK